MMPESDSNSVLPNQESIDSVTPQTESSQERGQPQINPPPSSYVPPPPKHKEPPEACRPDQTPIGKYVLEVLAAGILAAYTVAAFWQLDAMRGQLTEMQGSGKQTDQMLDLARHQLEQFTRQAADTHNLALAASDQATALKDSNALNIVSNRPWVGQTEGFASDISFVPSQAGGMMIEYLWRIRNSGHRPAQIEKIETTGTSFNKCTMNPDYTQPRDAAMPEGKSPTSRASSKEMLLPGGQFTSRYREYIPHGKWPQIVAGSTQYCIYISIAYRDVDYPKLLHHTTDCEVLMPQVPTFAGCTIPYEHAD